MDADGGGRDGLWLDGGWGGMTMVLFLAGAWQNCSGDECVANIYSKTYTEGSDPSETL